MVSIYEACKALGMAQEVLEIAKAHDKSFDAGCPIASMSYDLATYWLDEYAVAVSPDDSWAALVVNDMVRYALQARVWVVARALSAC